MSPYTKKRKIQYQDVIFVVRKEPKKYGRGLELAYLKEKFKKEKKAFHFNPSSTL